ncbi:uncharacterized protein LOC100844466 [Brachypodium distachyon]|uniref:Uncharacterized protein n=1 Tax=Brachypodium distachyon TaxID=15368 RepID=I1HLB1_BRADI|nr:uncharacterized protein LOC100844466 [Brachypodium distachyon]KQK07244.1 hypothetical protein BRADI_2g34130v3 [Brachypodium distachyon]|eukprot:XP_003568823.1 uncharacterized protein LOC100844466 [Brachypodium distachyon]
MAMAPTVSAVSFSARPSVSPVTVRPPRAVCVSASAGSGRARAGAPEGGKWWAPLVGWSGRADYIKAAAPAALAVVEEEEEGAVRPFVGGLTEAKARQLRARMVETESFHDAMYHSAIASRLARSA